MADLLACIQKGDNKELIGICEATELEIACGRPAALQATSVQPEGSQNPASPTSPTASAANELYQLYTILLLAYLIDNDLNSARFLIKRVPLNIRQSFPTKDFQTLVQVTNRLWVRDLQSVYPLLIINDETNGTAEQDGEDTAMNVEGEAPSADQHTWSPAVVPLVKSLAEQIRERSLNLLGRAYESISVSDAAIHLGYGTPSESQEFVTGKGWRVEQNWLFPPAPGAVVDGVGQGSKKEVKDELAHLTAFVTQLGRS
ncbi:hypothetical protein HK097_011586 [Rhizophlyctis rosea]|uniref:CSN8/PSMD8/EIF3K domain-containing protein n=1 Tax=Rhizophlyctis rosea TaxID=64517 RepID=A0AAD5WZ50_9FUNG|nr:hypothetical protein HK097_011586 [Rhizophlyctis rosea]